MSWGDKASSPCAWTPAASDSAGMTLPRYITLADGSLSRYMAKFFRFVFTDGIGNQLLGGMELYELDANGNHVIFSPTNMTGPTGGGFTISMSDAEWSAAWKGFDGSHSTYWQHYPTAATFSIKIECPSAHCLSRYIMRYETVHGYSYYPNNWRIECSDTGAFAGEEKILDSHTGYYNTQWLPENKDITIDILYNGVAENNLGTIVVAKQLAAQAFKPTSPAKLSDIVTVTPQLSGGTGGIIKLYAMHLHDRLTAWSSLADVAGEATLVGTLAHNTPLSMPDWTPGPNEQILFWFGFDNASGNPPTLLSLSVPWASDVTAPSAPTISALTGVLPNGGTVGYRVDFDLPTTSRHDIIEGKLNSGSWLPFSPRAKMETGQGYMKFRGDLSATEAAGERNETHLSFAKGLVTGDVVQIRVAAVDDVDNQSAFTTSDAVTLEAANTGAAPILYIEDAKLSAGGTGVIKVHLVGISEDAVSVDIDSFEGTATAPEDFTAISGTVNFDGDAEDGHRIVEVAINATGSAPQNGVTTYTLTLSNSSGPTIERATGTVTIINAEVAPQLYIDDAIVFSGQTGTIRVHLVGVSATEVSATIASAEGTALAPEDFTAIDTEVVFEGDAEDGHRVAEITINATGTDPQAGTTAYTMVLSDPVGAIIERGTGTVSVRNVAYVPVIADPVEVEITQYDEVEVEI